MWDEIMDMPGEIFDIYNDGISYEMNHSDPNYQEYIFKNGQYIGEIYGTVLGGYELRKVNEIAINDGDVTTDLNTIAYFDTVCDAKDFVNQAGGL